MGQITATRNLVATKVVRLAGQKRKAGLACVSWKKNPDVLERNACFYLGFYIMVCTRLTHCGLVTWYRPLQTYLSYSFVNIKSCKGLSSVQCRAIFWTKCKPKKKKIFEILTFSKNAFDSVVCKTSAIFRLQCFSSRNSQHIEAETKWPPIFWQHFMCIFLNENIEISVKISMKIVPNGSINNILALVQIMACAGQATSHYQNQWYLVYWL